MTAFELIPGVYFKTIELSGYISEFPKRFQKSHAISLRFDGKRMPGRARKQLRRLGRLSWVGSEIDYSAAGVNVVQINSEEELLAQLGEPNAH